MKKTLYILLFVFLIAPVVTFFGCGDENYYSYKIQMISELDGTIYTENNFYQNGEATFKEGTKISIKATPFKEKNKAIVGWVFNDTELIVDGTKGYSITENADGSQELSFSASASNQGSYTIVFGDENDSSLVPYVKLDEIYFESEETSNLVFSTFDVYQGATIPSTSCYSVENFEMAKDMHYKAENVSQILYLTALTSNPLSTKNPKRVLVSAVMGDSVLHFENEKVYFGANQESENVVFENGRYLIKFDFNISGGETANVNGTLVLVYKPLEKLNKILDNSEIME